MPSPFMALDHAWQGYYDSCGAGPEPSPRDFLPPGLEGEARRHALVSLIAVDQEYRWRPRAVLSPPPARREVAGYLAEWPELRRPDILAELLGNEQDCRPEGEKLSGSDFIDRLGVLLDTHIEGPRRADSPPPPAGAPILPHYKVIRRLDEGGQATVWLAVPEDGSREEAVKVLAGFEPEQMLRFGQEIEAFNKLNEGLQDPGVVQILRWGFDHPPYFYAMKYYPAGSLGGLLRERGHRPLPPKEAAKLVADAAETFGRIHDQGIIHRDVKPANFLLRDEPFRGDQVWDPARLREGDTVGYRPVIADLGYARLSESKAGLTPPDTAIGTPEYMSPEQASGDSTGVREPADVYAVGAVLYECLTGHAPFKGTNHRQTINLVLSKDPVAPRQLNPEVPRDLETIAMKCLRKDPADRYSSAPALADDLRRFLGDEPIRARPVGRAERAWKWGKKHPAYVGWGSAGFMAIIGLFAIGFWWWGQVARHDEAKRLFTAGVEDVRNERYEDGRVKLTAAQSRLAGLVRPTELGSRIDNELAGIDLVTDIEEARIDLLVINDGRPDRKRADLLFTRAFRNHGISPNQQPDDTLRRFRYLGVAIAVSQGMDTWALVKMDDDPAGAEQLLVLSSRMDDDPDRQAIRGHLLRGGRADLERLAAEALARTAVQPVATWLTLARALARVGDATVRVEVLRRAQEQHPTDPLVNHTIAAVLHEWSATQAQRQEAHELIQKALITRPGSAALWSNAGMLLTELRRWAEAERAFDRALRLDPELGAAYLGRAALHARQWQWQKAAGDAKQAVALAPHLAMAHASQGFILAHAGDPGALEACDKAAKMDPQLAAAYLNRSAVLLRLGRPTEALADCRKAQQLDRRLAMAYVNESYSLDRLGQSREALAACEAAVRLDPRLGEAYVNRAALRSRERTYDAAVADLRTALEYEPDLPLAHANLAGAMLEVGGSPKTALEHCDRALTIDDREAVAYCNRGAAHAALLEWEAARSDCDRAIAIEPLLLPAYVTRGFILVEMGKLDEALTTYQQAVDLAMVPAPPELRAVLLSNYAHAWVLKKDFERAVEAARRARGLDPGFLDASVNLADALFLLSRLKANRNDDPAEVELIHVEGAEVARQALMNHTRSEHLHFQLARHLYNLGKITEAGEHYNSAAALAPTKPLLLQNQIMFLLALGRPEEALVWWGHWTKLDPGVPAVVSLELAQRLGDRGRFADSLACTKEAQRAGARVDHGIRELEEIVELEKRLPSVVAGEDQPRKSFEWLAFAHYCRQANRNAQAVAFFKEAFKLDGDIPDEAWELAGFTAALASTGQGDAAKLTDDERKAMRAEALNWLSSAYAKYESDIEQARAVTKLLIRARLANWQTTEALAGLRPPAIGNLPEKERSAWQQFWNRLERGVMGRNRE